MHFTCTASSIFRVRHHALLRKQPSASFVHRAYIFLSRVYFTMPNMVSIFMASQCGIIFNIRKLLIYLRNNINNLFFYRGIEVKSDLQTV